MCGRSIDMINCNRNGETQMIECWSSMNANVSTQSAVFLRWHSSRFLAFSFLECEFKLIFGEDKLLKAIIQETLY